MAMGENWRLGRAPYMPRSRSYPSNPVPIIPSQRLQRDRPVGRRGGRRPRQVIHHAVPDPEVGQEEEEQPALVEPHVGGAVDNFPIPQDPTQSYFMGDASHGSYVTPEHLMFQSRCVSTDPYDQTNLASSSISGGLFTSPPDDDTRVQEHSPPFEGPQETDEATPEEPPRRIQPRRNTRGYHCGTSRHPTIR